jgi:hypothetical protein
MPDTPKLLLIEAPTVKAAIYALEVHTHEPFGDAAIVPACNHAVILLNARPGYSASSIDDADRMVAVLEDAILLIRTTRVLPAIPV